MLVTTAVQGFMLLTGKTSTPKSALTRVDLPDPVEPTNAMGTSGFRRTSSKRATSRLYQLANTLLSPCVTNGFAFRLSQSLKEPILISNGDDSLSGSCVSLIILSS